MSDIVIHYELITVDNESYRRQDRDTYDHSKSFHVDLLLKSLFNFGFRPHAEVSQFKGCLEGVCIAPSQIKTVIIERVEIVDD